MGPAFFSQSFNVRKVRLMITKFARLEFELFTKPSKSDFLRIHQTYVDAEPSEPYKIIRW